MVTRRAVLVAAIILGALSPLVSTATVANEKPLVLAFYYHADW